MVIEKEAVVVLLKQILRAKPELRTQIKSSRENLFAMMARVFIFDEMRREFAFDRSEMSEIFNALLEPNFPLLTSERARRFFEHAVDGAISLQKNEQFRQIVALALLEAAGKQKSQ